jgi:hypothetical protein
MMFSSFRGRCKYNISSENLNKNKVQEIHLNELVQVEPSKNVVRATEEMSNKWFEHLTCVCILPFRYMFRFRDNIHSLLIRDNVLLQTQLQQVFAASMSPVDV